MDLKFKELNSSNQQPTRQAPVQRAPMNAIGSPIGTPIGVYKPTQSMVHQQRKQSELPPPAMPGHGLKRAVNYYADYAGCGWWRMIQPETLLNIEQKSIVNGLTTMVLDPRFYAGIQSVRLQRQATPVQLEFVKFLKAGSKEHGFRVIYEIDDVIFKDDIPDFNRCKVAFEDDNILKSSIEMMQLCDEVSVTCQFMKEYYMHKTGNPNVTVLPNYPSKMWMDGHYNTNRLYRGYESNKNRPRVAYIGSGTHIDVGNKTNQKDDFHHVVQSIIKTRHKFKWVFVGCYPLPCKPFIDRGEMEFVPWFPLKDLALAYTSINCQAVYAPLVDCIFNRAKSNIKYLESACCGVPGVFQDMCTYQDAPLRFRTGEDLIDQLDVLLKDEQTYAKYSQASRAYADTMWLDDHLDEFVELYFTEPRTPERKALLRLNPDQASPTTYNNSLLK